MKRRRFVSGETSAFTVFDGRFVETRTSTQGTKRPLDAGGRKRVGEKDLSQQGRRRSQIFEKW